MWRAARNRGSIPRGSGNSRSSNSGHAAARARMEICRAWSRVASAASSGAVTSSLREGWRRPWIAVTASPLLVRGALVRYRSLERFEVELLVEAWQISFSGSDEQFVGDVHHDAVVAGSVLGDRGLELGGHESRVPRNV